MKINSQATAPKFEWRFLLPRFWLTWCALFLLRLTLLLPRRAVMLLGGLLGDCMRRRNHKRRRNAEINLAMCFPKLDARARDKMLAAHFRFYGRGLLDLALTLWGSDARIDSLCSIARREWFRELGRRAPVIVVAYHLTTLDVNAAALARIHPNVSMMKRDRNPLVNWQLWKARTRQGDVQLVMRDQGLRPLVRAMRRGRACFLIPDEDLSSQTRGVFTPFFGVPTATMTVVGRLAKLSGARVVPCAARLDARSGKYFVNLGDAIRNFPSDDEHADAAALNRAMEKLIARAPEQYMWTFRWFARRPDGAPGPY